MVKKPSEVAERPKEATAKPAAPGNAAVEDVQASVAGDVLNALTPEQAERLNARGLRLLQSRNVTKFNKLRKEKLGWKPNLSGANLYIANLSGANLIGADLSGADLRDIKGATAEQLAQAHLISTTWSDNALCDAAFEAQRKSTRISS